MAKIFGVPGVLLLAICTNESNLKNVTTPNDHGSPTYGICQIKSDTAKSLGYKGGTEGLMSPTVNARYAALYLKKQLGRYDGDWCMSVAAYNAGSFYESVKFPGKPRNFVYVKKVTLLLDEKYRDYLTCGPRKVEIGIE